MPRKRPVERLSRDRIVEVAFRQFVRCGYHKMSLNDVARALGVVKGALYYYIPGGKRELLDAVVNRLDEEMYAAMVAAADAEPDPGRALVQAVEGKLAVLGAWRDRFEHRREAVDEMAQLLAQREREFTRRERALFETILARGEAAGSLRTLKSRATVAGAIQVVIRAIQMKEVFDIRVNPDRGPSLLPPVFELILRGLEVRP